MGMLTPLTVLFILLLMVHALSANFLKDILRIDVEDYIKNWVRL